MSGMRILVHESTVYVDLVSSRFLRREKERDANAKSSIVLDKWYFVCLIMTFFLKSCYLCRLTFITLVFHLRFSLCVEKKKQEEKKHKTR